MSMHNAEWVVRLRNQAAGPLAGRLHRLVGQGNRRDTDGGAPRQPVSRGTVCTGAAFLLYVDVKSALLDAVFAGDFDLHIFVVLEEGRRANVPVGQRAAFVVSVLAFQAYGHLVEIKYYDGPIRFLDTLQPCLEAIAVPPRFDSSFERRGTQGDSIRVRRASVVIIGCAALERGAAVVWLLVCNHTILDGTITAGCGHRHLVQSRRTSLRCAHAVKLTAGQIGAPNAIGPTTVPASSRICSVVQHHLKRAARRGRDPSGDRSAPFFGGPGIPRRMIRVRKGFVHCWSWCRRITLGTRT
jgi:hypothetical protein